MKATAPTKNLSEAKKATNQTMKATASTNDISETKKTTTPTMKATAPTKNLSEAKKATNQTMKATASTNDISETKKATAPESSITEHSASLLPLKKIQKLESTGVPLSSNTNNSILLENEALPFPPLPGFDDLLGEESQPASNNTVTSEYSQVMSKDKGKQSTGNNQTVKNEVAKKTEVKNTKKVKPVKTDHNNNHQTLIETETAEKTETKDSIKNMDDNKIAATKTKGKNLVSNNKSYPKRTRSKVFTYSFK